MTSTRQSSSAAGLLDYWLPPELIAQQPAPERDQSRLMIVDRASGELHHAHFDDLGAWLPPAALLVANDSKVVPARLRGHKIGSGGAVEALLLDAGIAAGATRATALTRSSKPLRHGQRLAFAHDVTAVVEGPVEDGRCVLEFAPHAVVEALAVAGELPLPPYIDRPEGPSAEDAERYQTVYARSPGSVAAPTAGLHFTDALLQRLQTQGFAFTKVTLHVGPGTFTPVRGSLDEHRMEEEQFEIGEDAAAAIRLARAEGRPIVPVGTTTVRALEGALHSLRLTGDRGQGIRGCSGRTSLFIRPGYRFALADALLTNFHLPGSTLLALVTALAGEQLLRKAYAAAVEQRYRFYSFGDAMLIR